MEIKKSREYTQDDGSKVSFTFDRSDGKIVNIKKDGVSVDPSSEDFTNFSTSEDARAAYNVAKYGNAKKSYLNKSKFAERRGDNTKTSEELTDYYNTEVKKDLNQQKIDAQEEKAKQAIATQNASPKTGNSLLRYPLDFDINQDHFKIVRHEYVRPGINQSKAAGVQSQTSQVNRRNARRSTGPGRTYTTHTSTGDGVLGAPISTIFLPMPKVADVNGVEWGKSELTISGLAGLGAAQKLADAGRFIGLGTGEDKKKSEEALEALKGEQGGALTGTNVAGSAATEFKRALTAQTLSGLAGALTGSNLDADTFLARTSGRVLNPNAEVLFQGPVIRDFAFSFIMIARSQREGAEIRRIIRELKIGMAPKFRSTTFLKNPDVFSLEYKSGGNTLNTVNRFNKGGLALQTISVDYSPNGYWSAYRDSQPVQLKMDLSFTELRPIYESDQEDTPEDSVGL